MSTHDNAPPPDDWRPERRHCGEICFDVVCPVCREYVVPKNIELGSE